MSEVAIDPLAERRTTAPSGRAAGASLRDRLASVPPTFFAIAFGTAGLGVTWRSAEPLLHTPSQIADAFFCLAGIAWTALMSGLVVRVARSPQAVLLLLKDPVLAPFMVMPGIVVLVLAGGLAPHSPGAAGVVALAALAVVVGLGAWTMGEWIAGPVATQQVHPAWFLPTVAGGFLGASVCALTGHTTVAWLSFGVGALGWLQLGPLILGRLIMGAPLPAALVPTLAIEAAPPALAGSAYFALQPGPLDPLTYALAGSCVLSVLVQVRLAPAFLRLRFGPEAWAFTFSYTAVAAYAMRWLERTDPSQERMLGWLVVGAITAFVGAVACKTLMAVAAHRFFPVQRSRREAS